ITRHASDAKPRIAIYNPWGGSLDEGWTRWLLDQYGFAPKSVHPQDLKAGLQNFDVLILPDIDKEEIANGRRKPEEGSMRYQDELPPEYRGSLKKEGADVLKKFVWQRTHRAFRLSPAASRADARHVSDGVRRDLLCGA